MFLSNGFLIKTQQLFKRGYKNVKHQEDKKRNQKVVMYPERQRLGKQSESYGLNHSKLGDSETGGKVQYNNGE